MDISQYTTVKEYSLRGSLPDQCREGTWVGRAWLPRAFTAHGVAGPHVIRVADGVVYELSERFKVMAELLNCEDPAQAVRATLGREVCTLDALLENSLFPGQPEDVCDLARPCLLSPNDIQAVKACGVTFIRSLLERIIEEKALGDAEAAIELRATIHRTIGENLNAIKPGSEETERLKKQLMEQDMWSPYLEVGIGKDAEVFTKCQPLSSIGSGAQLGVLSTSAWNNPEPEIALFVSAQGNIIGATLANDVNLRDYEGRSALLLGKAKDQNGSCPIGPLLRLFDDTFTLEDIEEAAVTLRITGEDGFQMSGASLMTEISRSPTDIIAQICNRNHQYPDGLVVMLGTMFAPTEDRGEPGQGFTHKPGDRVEISTPKLGKLVNWVNYCDEIPEWRYGIAALMQFLAQTANAVSDRSPS